MNGGSGRLNTFPLPRGFGERCKLQHLRSGRIFDGKCNLYALVAQKTRLVVANVVSFW